MSSPRQLWLEKLKEAVIDRLEPDEMIALGKYLQEEGEKLKGGHNEKN